MAGKENTEEQIDSYQVLDKERSTSAHTFPTTVAQALTCSRICTPEQADLVQRAIANYRAIQNLLGLWEKKTIEAVFPG